MFSSFFEGTQQDWKIMIVAPVICAVFRLAFIWVYDAVMLPKNTAPGAAHIFVWGSC